MTQEHGQQKAGNESAGKPESPRFALLSFTQVRKSIDYLIFIVGPIGAVIFKFDPLVGVWLLWGWVVLLIITHGIQLALWCSGYYAGIVVAGALIIFASAQYVERVTGWLLCSPIQSEEVLTPSALPSPPNPCLPVPNSRKDLAFVFFGTNAGPALSGARP
jgi:hypothetical protein